MSRVVITVGDDRPPQVRSEREIAEHWMRSEWSRPLLLRSPMPSPGRSTLDLLAELFPSEPVDHPVPGSGRNPTR